jgi:amino acid transporter
MLFSYAVRAIYIESSAMFVRGGVYRVVKEAMGGSLAKLSVSALLFDYILTGPISSVSAVQYFTGLIVSIFEHLGHPVHISEAQINYCAAAFSVAVTIYFWWKNTQGIHESSDKALKIMKITTVMVVLLIVWCLVTVVKTGAQLPPLPSRDSILAANQASHGETLGWLTHIPWLTTIPFVLFLVGFGHSVLAMSGEESLAQVNREIEHPKLKNLQRAGLVIFLYSLFFTSLVSFFAVMIIPDGVRSQYFANLIGGLAMYVVGPTTVKLFFQAFVVLVGALILSGAVNTAIVGANGVLNRVSEDGVLTPWFRKPHPRYGTSYRLINMIVGLQLFTIIASRGNVYLLASLYAFGVIWSFTFNGLSAAVLRFTERQKREFKVPGNIRVGDVEIPIGIALITLFLLMIALVNLATKPLATISGLAFSIVLMVVPTTNVFDGILQTAQRLESSKIVSGLSNRLTLDEQGKLTGDAWERLPEPRPRLKLEIHAPDGAVHEYRLGPHTPRLRREDIDLLHKLWLQATSDPDLASLHHFHIVRLALEKFQHSLQHGEKEALMDELKQELRKHNEEDDEPPKPPSVN